jgi:hypothetical protein
MIMSVLQLTADNPRLIHKMLLGNVKFGMLCAHSVTITGPIFFADSKNSEW